MKYYRQIYETILEGPAIDTHCHHIQDERFEAFNLDQILRTSYVSWCKAEFDLTQKSREAYLDKVRYKSFFRSLQASLMKIYGIDEELTAENWDKYNEIIARKYEENVLWHIDLMKATCKYEKVILDAYWNPGDDNNHPDLFTTTFRVDPDFFGFDKSVLDHDGFNTYSHYGKEFKNIDSFMEFIYELIQQHVQTGSVCIKNAIAYDRTVKYEIVDKAAANKVFKDKHYTKTDVKNFQDYFFNGVCKIAAELNVPVQCHTGMGQLGGTRAINMLEIIKDNPNTKFSLMHGSFPWCSDILAYLDMFPNVFADVVWLPSLSPTMAESMIHELIEVGTSERVVWGCDTWNSEESYAAKMLMADVLAHVLDEKIERGYFKIQDAYKMAEKIMYHNAKMLFNIQ